MIVYSTISCDGTVRMALHPMNSAPNMTYKTRVRKIYDFRVIHSTKYRVSWWDVSRRGKDKYLSSAARTKLSDCPSIDNALAWLVEGEADQSENM